MTNQGDTFPQERDYSFLFFGYCAERLSLVLFSGMLPGHAQALRRSQVVLGIYIGLSCIQSNQISAYTTYPTLRDLKNFPSSPDSEIFPNDALYLVRKTFCRKMSVDFTIKPISK